MTSSFADTCFWVALANSRDNLHANAVALSKIHSKLITTQEVLGEFLNYFSTRGKELRLALLHNSISAQFIDYQ